MIVNKKIFIIILIIGIIIGYFLNFIIPIRLDPWLQGIVTAVIAGSSFIAFLVALGFEILPFLVNWWEKNEKDGDKMN